MGYMFIYENLLKDVSFLVQFVIVTLTFRFTFKSEWEAMWSVFQKSNKLLKWVWKRAQKDQIMQMSAQDFSYSGPRSLKCFSWIFFRLLKMCHFFKLSPRKIQRFYCVVYYSPHVQHIQESLLFLSHCSIKEEMRKDKRTLQGIYKKRQ